MYKIATTDNRFSYLQIKKGLLNLPATKATRIKNFIVG